MRFWASFFASAAACVHLSEAAFVPSTFSTKKTSTNTWGRHDQPELQTSSGKTALPMIMDYQGTFSWLATIDADIDNIPTDSFGLVFAGGIVVMLGGIVSAVIVGAILESNPDSYARVIGDSYAAEGEKEFWESMSPEQREEAKEMLEDIKKSRGEKSGEQEKEKKVEPEKAVVPEKRKEPVSMFSDYDDEA